MIRYRSLFQVDITHDYFLSRGDVVFEAQPSSDQSALSTLYTVANFLEIFPDDATLVRLAGHKMIFRATQGGFIVAVQIDPLANDLRPAIPPGTEFNLTFALRLKDARFANYTELGSATTTDFFRFGNDSQNEVAGVCFLTRPIPGFDASRSYFAGDTYSAAAGPTFNLFVALRDTGPSAAPISSDWRQIPVDTWDAAATYQAGAVVLSGNRLFRALVNAPGTDLGNAANWQAAGVLSNQYVTAADTILPVSGVFNLDISSVALSTATIRLFRGNSSTVAVEQTFAAEQGTLGQVQLDLRTLASGPYRLQVLRADLTVVPLNPAAIYLSPRAVTAGWFGVIEINLGVGDFALLNADGTLRAPRFIVRFLNRATRWRYIFPAAQAVGTGAEVAPEAGDGRTLVTGSVRPLTRFGAGSRLQVDNPATSAVSEEVLLPLPEVDLVRRQNTQWYSETRVPNITLGP